MNSNEQKENNKGKTPRIMRPSIPTMTVQEERRCLAEIRKHGADLDPHFRLENEMQAGDFALMYIAGHHRKRQDKNKNKTIVEI
jgi:hypothetical protein